MYSIAMESPKGYPLYTKEDPHIMKRSISQENTLFFGPLCLQFFLILQYIFFPTFTLYDYSLQCSTTCWPRLPFGIFQVVKQFVVCFLSSICLHQFFVFKLSQTGFLCMHGLLFFLVALGCIFVLGSQQNKQFKFLLNKFFHKKVQKN